MKFFSREQIENGKKLHFAKGRLAWKYKPLTSKQRSFLRGCEISDSDLNGIDRGVAHTLIAHVIDMNREAGSWQSADWSGENNYEE